MANAASSNYLAASAKGAFGRYRRPTQAPVSNGFNAQPPGQPSQSFSNHPTQMPGRSGGLPINDFHSSPSLPPPANGQGQMGQEMGFDDGGEVSDDGEGIPNRQPGGEDRNTFNISNALEAVDNAMRYGYKRLGIGGGGGNQSSQDTQGFDDGGEVDEAIPSQDDPSTTDSASADQMQQASPTQPDQSQQPANPQQLVGLVQGAGAMPTTDAIGLMHSTGEADPDVAKLKVAEALQDQPDKLWAFLQSLRQHFNLERAAAAVKTQGGHIDAALKTGQEMLSNVLDGTYTTLSKTANGVLASVHNVEDDKPIGAAELSPEQWMGFLTGPDGGYDQIHNNSIMNIFNKLKAPPGQGVTTTPGETIQGLKEVGQKVGNWMEDPERGTKILSGVGNSFRNAFGGQGSQAAPAQDDAQGGSQQVSPQQAAANAPPMPTGRGPSAQSRVTAANRALGGNAAPQAPETPAAPEDPYDMPAGTKQRIEEQSRRIFPMISQEQQRQQWIAAKESEYLGVKSKLDVANVGAGAKVDSATIRAENLTTREEIRAASQDRKTNAQLQGTLAIVDAKRYGSQMAAAASFLRGRLNEIAYGGKPLTPEEEQGASNLMKAISQTNQSNYTQQSNQTATEGAPRQQQQPARLPNGKLIPPNAVRIDQVNTGLQGQ